MQDTAPFIFVVLKTALILHAAVWKLDTAFSVLLSIFELANISCVLCEGLQLAWSMKFSIFEVSTKFVLVFLGELSVPIIVVIIPTPNVDIAIIICHRAQT